MNNKWIILDQTMNQHYIRYMECSAGERVGCMVLELVVCGVKRAMDRAAVSVVTTKMTAAGADTGPGGKQTAQWQLLA